MQMQVESQPRLTRAAAVNSVMWESEEEELTKDIIFRLLGCCPRHYRANQEGHSRKGNATK